MRLDDQTPGLDAEAAVCRALALANEIAGSIDSQTRALAQSIYNAVDAESVVERLLNLAQLMDRATDAHTRSTGASLRSALALGATDDEVSALWTRLAPEQIPSHPADAISDLRRALDEIRGNA